MRAEEAFAAIQEYYASLLKPRIRRLVEEDLGQDEIRTIAKEILLIAKDRTVDGVEFPCNEIFLEGNNKKCVEGTVLDVYDENSLSYPHFKRMVVAAKCILSKLDGESGRRFEHLLRKHKFTFEDATIEDSIEVLRNVSDSIFGENGLFQKAKTKAKEGKWRSVRGNG